MKVLTTEQRTPEWHMARRGKITASRIGDVLAGAGTKRRQAYRLQLVLDLEGVDDFATSEEDLAPWQRDGVAWEEWARGWYAWQPGCQEVTTTGFVVSDEVEFVGCSPDGLVGQDGGIEIKFHKNLRLLRENVDRVPRATSDQMQMAMHVCNRQWWDLVNFWRDDQMNLEKGHILRVWRDPSRIDYLLERSASFYLEVLEEVKRRKS